MWLEARLCLWLQVHRHAGTDAVVPSPASCGTPGSLRTLQPQLGQGNVPPKHLPVPSASLQQAVGPSWSRDRLKQAEAPPLPERRCRLWYSPSTQDGAARVVPATCPGKQEHFTVWERSSILFLLQHL